MKTIKMFSSIPKFKKTLIFSANSKIYGNGKNIFTNSHVHENGQNIFTNSAIYKNGEIIFANSKIYENDGSIFVYLNGLYGLPYQFYILQCVKYI